MIPNYTQKWEYLIKKNGPYCPVQRDKGDESSPLLCTDLHHRCHNTKWRLKKFPLFMNSLLNLLPVSNFFHLKYPSNNKITDFQAEKYERFLERHPKISEFVNGI